MNRPIIFRGWLERTKEFMKEIELGDGDDGYICHDKNGEMVYVGDLVWQQFTGLFDKNGAPIYEGDILNWESNSMSHRLGECKRTRIVSVKWQEKSASFIAEANKHDLLHTPMYWRMDTNDFNGKPFIKEVIGNVFENSDLLQV